MTSWATALPAVGLALMLPLAAGAKEDVKTDNRSEPPWSARCTSPARDAPADCQMEQRAIVTETHQLLLQLAIHVPGSSRKPVLSVRAPLTAFLPAGVVLRIDEGNETRLAYQACDQQGCYATSALSGQLLEAMTKGVKLNITIQARDGKSLTVPMSLVGFTEVYAKVR
jgi:invasion protein IalB